MDQAHVDQLLDPQTISRAEALGLQARWCSGPKGRNSIAQGNALGSRHNKLSSPERAELPAGWIAPGFALSGLERICVRSSQGVALGYRMTGFQPSTSRMVATVMLHNVTVALRDVTAPKGRDSEAQGNALGQPATNPSSPERAKP